MKTKMLLSVMMLIFSTLCFSQNCDSIRKVDSLRICHALEIKYNNEIIMFENAFQVILTDSIKKSFDSGYVKGKSECNLQKTENLKSEKMEVYPNPTSDIINISNLSFGVYFLTLYNENGSMILSKKIIKE